jgi:flagellar basal-body rod protein FlgC
MSERVGLFRSLAIPASGLSAQRRRMELIAANIANAQVTGGPGGAPYARRDAVLAPSLDRAPVSPLKAGELPADVLLDGEPAPGVTVAEITERPGSRLQYEPGHPDADENGYVRYPDVDVTQELVSMMETRRLYEANATVFQAIKNILQRSLEL